MTVPIHPPLLLRKYATSVPGVEMFLSTASESQAVVEDPHEDLKILALKSQAGESYNQYIFTQYLIYLYVNIFVNYDTSYVVANVLRNVSAMLRESLNDKRVTDRSLKELLYKYLPEGQPDAYGRGLVDALRVVYGRLTPNLTTPGIDDIMDVVGVIYDDRPTTAPAVLLYQASLTQLEGDAPLTLVLTPTRVRTLIDTTACYMVADKIWKLIFGLNIPSRLEHGGLFTMWMTEIASLALPIDPIALLGSMRYNMSDDQKAGVPFLNYLAMFLRQYALGLDYKLSRLADPRRLIMQQLHRFCGIGGTFIRDPDRHAQVFLRMLEAVAEKTDRQVFVQADADLFLHLREALSYTKVQFVRKLNYGGLEAAKVKPEDDEEPDTTKAKPKDKKTPDADPDTTAFADDADPTAEDPTDTSTDDSDPSQTGDDIIGQTGDTNQTVPPRPTSTLLPLALPTETIDDHLYRLTVLRFVSHIVNATDPDIPAEAVNLLRIWCGAFLFIAAVTPTKALVSQLKLTEKLKEFAE
jgi:hypothetical protein